jgi:ADP-ribosylglycohydrolase
MHRATGPESGVAWTAFAVGIHTVKAFDDFSAGMRFTISLGRDTDTNAAVAGALPGARLGPAAIPRRWLSALRDRERIERAAVALLTWRAQRGEAGRSTASIM